MPTDTHAGTLIEPSEVLDVEKLVKAFFEKKPDIAVASQRVAFGTSGHRGCAFDTSFNENHIVAITQAICRYRAARGITGPLFLGRDTHAVSEPAFRTALEVLAGNEVKTMVDAGKGYTPTPVISHAIIDYNSARTESFADGIIITPSHNPPEDGGIKYNPPHGGPAETAITSWIENTANQILTNNLRDIRRSGKIPPASEIILHNYMDRYVGQLESVVDLDLVREAAVRIGVDPLGGAAVNFWAVIADRFKLDLTVTDSTVDPTFKTIPRDWDGKIRMDCSSPYPMKRLLSIKDRFDVAFANDTDADRHGIVGPSGLMEPNIYLAVCAHYLRKTRESFAGRKIGKTIVSSSMIDRVAKAFSTEVIEVPVGFKWFVDGITSGSVYFAGEESAGSAFLRRDGSRWTTDKDGIIAGLLAAEITAHTGRAPDAYAADLKEQLGETFYARIDKPADKQLRSLLSSITTDAIKNSELGGDPISRKETIASGNGAAIGGIKLSTKNGWIAARPSGTEDVYKIYAESYSSGKHLNQLQSDAQTILGQMHQ
jgi:phosphoglucomutase